LKSKLEGWTPIRHSKVRFKFSHILSYFPQRVVQMVVRDHGNIQLNHDLTGDHGLTAAPNMQKGRIWARKSVIPGTRYNKLVV